MEQSHFDPGPAIGRKVYPQSLCLTIEGAMCQLAAADRRLLWMLDNPEPLTRAVFPKIDVCDKSSLFFSRFAIRDIGAGRYIATQCAACRITRGFGLIMKMRHCR